MILCACRGPPWMMLNLFGNVSGVGTVGRGQLVVGLADHEPDDLRSIYPVLT